MKLTSEKLKIILGDFDLIWVFQRFKQHFSCCQPSAEVLCLRQQEQKALNKN
jgi:hypothetical protein